MVHCHGNMLATLPCSFVKEFTALRRKVERDPSNTGLMMLANLINALRDCVSLLRERKHDAILSEVLGIKLWGAPPVSAVKQQGQLYGHVLT